jgi:hypothetical protein
MALEIHWDGHNHTIHLMRDASAASRDERILAQE